MSRVTAEARRVPEDPDALVWKTVSVLSLAGGASGLSQRVLDPLLPRLAEEFGRPIAVVSWVITCFSLGYAVSQLLFGPIGDRFGKLRVVTWGCAACFLTAVLCAAAPGLSLLIVARVLAGAMTAALIPLSMAWIGDSVPYERRQPVLARFAIGQILGLALGQLVGGLSADYFGRRAPFVLLATMFAVSTIMLQRVRRRLPAERAPPRSAGATSARLLLLEFVHVLREPWARTVVLSVFLEGAFVLGAFAFFATHLHGALHVSLTLAGSAAMLFGMGGLLFSFAARRLLSRLGEQGLVRIGAVLMLIMMIVVALAPPVAIVAASCLVMGLGFYMLHNTLQTNATQMAPTRRGAAVATFALAYFLGQALGVSCAGWAVSRFSIKAVIIVGACGATLTALNFARLRGRHESAARS